MMRALPLKASRGRPWSASRRFRGWLATWLQDRRRARAAAGTPAVPAPPNAPINLALADVASWIQLTWQDTSGDELGFRVYRKVDAGASALWQTLGPGVTMAQDSGVSPGHYYEYSVTAYNANGESGPSNIAFETYGV